MRTVKAICTATILVVWLSIPVFAGDISTPGINGTWPTPTEGTRGETTTDPGEINTPGLMDFLLSLVSTI